MQIDLLYFARLREALGIPGETLALPAEISTVAQLASWLALRGDAWLQLRDDITIRAAVNQVLVHGDYPLHVGDEVAFFPPVTGG